MRIGIVSAAVPLVNGGGRFIVDWLDVMLRARGHQVEALFLPSTDAADDALLPQLNAFRLLQLDGFDRLITLRPPAHLIRHPRKVVWFIHHMRLFYDMWDSPYRGFPDNARFRAMRDAIRAIDTQALGEAHRVFSNSAVVADRLARFNGIAARVLYPPVLHPERFTAGPYGDTIVCVCRMEHHKRQHLLVDAMRHTRTKVRLRLCGLGSDAGYVDGLRAASAGLDGRVTIEHRWIDEAEKADLLHGALANAYVPLDEDSYGYPTIEAAHARRCTITLSDAGGVSEFITDGVTGLCVPPDPVALAAAFDRLFEDRDAAARMGAAAERHVAELGIDWDTVLDGLLG